MQGRNSTKFLLSKVILQDVFPTTFKFTCSFANFQFIPIESFKIFRI